MLAQSECGYWSLHWPQTQKEVGSSLLLCRVDDCRRFADFCAVRLRQRHCMFFAYGISKSPSYFSSSFCFNMEGLPIDVCSYKVACHIEIFFCLVARFFYNFA